MTPDQPIGIFDSGLGGLTVAAAVRKLLPHEKIVYLGDTARVPYGNRSPETIRTFAEQDIAFLISKNVKAIVAACNTVSATALSYLQKKFPDLHISGVIEPGADAAAGARRIAVLGTRATINSGAYVKALRERYGENLEIIAKPCPLFVPMVEEGILGGPIAQEVIRHYLEKIPEPDTILLGCTHYPLLTKAINEHYNGKVRIVDSADAAAIDLKKYLTDNNLLAPADSHGSLQLYASDIASGFREQAARFLGTDVPEPGKVTLTD